MCHLWKSPDGNFKHTFLKLDLDCEPDKYPGIVIVTDEHYQHAIAKSVQNLNRELPTLLKPVAEKSVVYWWLQKDQNEVKRVLSGLTDHPVFADIK